MAVALDHAAKQVCESSQLAGPWMVRNAETIS
jgi:hypothetical protein